MEHIPPGKRGSRRRPSPPTDLRTRGMRSTFLLSCPSRGAGNGLWAWTTHRLLRARRPRATSGLEHFPPHHRGPLYRRTANTPV